METSGAVAHWSGDELTMWDSVQASSMVVPVLCDAFGLDAASARLHARHTGGGFGAKAFVWPHQILAAACARIIERPVRLDLRRSDQYSAVGYQPFVSQQVTFGADADGQLLAYRHEVTNATALGETCMEPATEAKAVYACDNISTRQQLERVSLNAPTALRAPMEGVGLWAIEGAMNELAAQTGIRSGLPGSRPLMLLHGWPGGVVKYLGVIASLTGATGVGRPAFDPVIPSLPCFGFSDRFANTATSSARLYAESFREADN